jgi:hypothetical protein
MKTAASIFSWLGGIATTIYAIVTVAKGIDVPVIYQTCGYYGCTSTIGVQHLGSPGWLWFLLIFSIIVRLIILIWRQYATSNGKKVGCGICTLLFASTIGGILTLCIPESELH